MEYFHQLRNDFPFLRIAILHITAPKEVVLDRAAVSAKLYQPDIRGSLINDILILFFAAMLRKLYWFITHAVRKEL